MSYEVDFVPVVRPDLLRLPMDVETVVWSPMHRHPAALDPVATVMLDVIDGRASIGDLVRDVEDVVGVPPEVASSQVQRVIAALDAGGLLATSEPEPPGMPLSLFANPVSSCMETSSCTGDVTAVSFEIGGHELRVACQSNRVARRLRAALADHVVPGRAPLGFLLRSSRRHPRRFVLVDRCGFVVATVQGSGQALATLGSHLSGLLPPPADRVRLRLRALVDERGATLCAWPLLFLPQLDERKLAALGLAVLDRLAVELDPETGAMVNVPAPWTFRGRTSPALGHLPASADPVPADRLLIGRPRSSAQPSPAELVVELAREAMSGERTQVLAACAAVARTATVHLVDPNSRTALYEALAAPASPPVLTAR